MIVFLHRHLQRVNNFGKLHTCILDLLEFKLQINVIICTCNDITCPCQSSLFHTRPSNLSSGKNESDLARLAASPRSTLRLQYIVTLKSLEYEIKLTHVSGLNQFCPEFFFIPVYGPPFLLFFYHQQLKTMWIITEENKTSKLQKLWCNAIY
jgi:hypothetical protein